MGSACLDRLTRAHQRKAARCASSQTPRARSTSKPGCLYAVRRLPLEAHGAFTRWLHGEAVAIGLVAELRAAARLGKTDPALAGRVAALLGRLDLPTAASHAWQVTSVGCPAKASSLPGVKMRMR